MPDTERKRKPRTPEKERNWQAEMRKQFRQTHDMAKIFYEMRKNEKYHFDPETGRVLFNDSSMPEGMPAALTPLIDPEGAKAEREAWDNRTTEIMSETKTWLRILDDGAVEIKYEHSRRDLGHRIPTVDLDDVPEALQAMTCRMRDEKEEEEEDPMGTAVDKASNTSAVVLHRSEEYFVLRPDGNGSGSVETWGWEQDYDYSGEVTKDEVTERATYPVGTEKVDSDMMTLRFNMLSELRYVLNKAVESEAPDHYAQLFTLPVRKEILGMAINEIQIAKKEGDKEEEKDEARVHGHSAFLDRAIFPQAQFSRMKTTTDANGVITVEHTHLEHSLDESYMAGEIEIPPPAPAGAPFGTLFEHSDKVHETIQNWKNVRKGTVGEDQYRAEIKAEIERLKQELVNNQGSVQGQVRVLTMNPADGTYKYYFAQRLLAGALDNHSGQTFVEIHEENPQNPSCDELATLLSLAI